VKIYAVGGAVRDALLGIPVHETDWVVVGGSADELLKSGFRPVGKDFPVFLHPETGEQYALARTERKTAPGYHGFAFDTSSHVTLEDDLARRDLTINAMARSDTGEIIDPWGGRRDLARRVLRHVSGAFGEDPLRVLRVARFAARLAPRAFQVARETSALMVEIVRSGELATLRPERVWQETDKALSEPAPDVYFEVLRECGALAVLFPEIEALFGVPQPIHWHPEIDTGIHTLMALNLATQLSREGSVRFAVLTHDLGKAATPAEFLPRHPGHEQRSADAIAKLALRYPIPRQYRELAELVARFHGLVHRSAELRARTLYQLIEAADGLRRPKRFEQFLLACEADARGRLGRRDSAYPQAERLLRAAALARAVPMSPEIAELRGADIAEALRSARIRAIRDGLPAR